MLRKEIAELRADNRAFKDKVTSLTHELDRQTRIRHSNDAQNSVSSENELLKSELNLERRENQHLTSELQTLKAEAQDGSRHLSECQRAYEQVKRDSDGLKREVRRLNFENDKL